MGVLIPDLGLGDFSDQHFLLMVAIYFSHVIVLLEYSVTNSKKKKKTNFNATGINK